MLSAFKKFRQEWQLRRNLRAYWLEMEKNLELFYVMEQRQFITETFKLDAWALVKDVDLVKRHESIVICAKSIEDFNKANKDYKDFETWYTSDIVHKTPDNARKLHHLKHELDMKLKGMEAIIIPAGQALEKEMVNLGHLKA